MWTDCTTILMAEQEHLYQDFGGCRRKRDSGNRTRPEACNVIMPPHSNLVLVTEVLKISAACELKSCLINGYPARILGSSREIHSQAVNEGAFLGIMEQTYLVPQLSHCVAV
jgi:hypothetical protein